MKTMFKKTILVAIAAALVLAALPFSSAFAMNGSAEGEVTNEKLEQMWARQLQAYERVGKGFEKTDEFTAKVQDRIDKAAANGKDVTALQAALDAYEAAVKNARPAYESIQGIVSAHQGFDANGKVTDAEKAKATVQAMRTKMQEVKTSMNGTFKALRDAIKAFREANQPAEGTSERGT
ncbi:MAG TPA: hypothetical protein PKE35_03350 [Anaerolineales bacterium]|nr:hypothetical protein [Anaerolineales bacterium]HMZ42874.1 hypothetical protein [Anaerolineales bacterium]